jgi:hypothetical protein
MDEVTAAHPANPEAWGPKAELYTTIASRTPRRPSRRRSLSNYPFGLLLRGRVTTRNMSGPDVQFRKAVDAYGPAAGDELPSCTASSPNVR